MNEIIDLSQEIYEGMPIFKGHPDVKISVHQTHENIGQNGNVYPMVNKLEFGEHTGTHVDALNHMRAENYGQSIDTMPLSMFYTMGVCLDFSHKTLNELIEAHELEEACVKQKINIEKGDTVLLYTDHYRKTYGSHDWPHGPGISASATTWLADKAVAAFGVETRSPGVSGVSNKEVHRICGERGFTHYENLINLHLLVGRGRFRFIGLPLKIRGGTGSPVRAVAVF